MGFLHQAADGKTTLLKIISGYQPGCRYNPCRRRTASTERLLSGRNTLQHPEYEVNPRLRMREVLKEGDGISKELIEGLGIEEDWKNRFPHKFSGGELQRFCIARALGKGTKYLLCESNHNNVRFYYAGKDMEFFNRGNEKTRDGMVIASHSQPLLDHVCTRQIRLNQNP